MSINLTLKGQKLAGHPCESSRSTLVSCTTPMATCSVLIAWHARNKTLVRPSSGNHWAELPPLSWVSSSMPSLTPVFVEFASASTSLLPLAWGSTWRLPLIGFTIGLEGDLDLDLVITNAKIIPLSLDTISGWVHFLRHNITNPQEKRSTQTRFQSLNHTCQLNHMKHIQKFKQNKLIMKLSSQWQNDQCATHFNFNFSAKHQHFCQFRIQIPDNPGSGFWIIWVSEWVSVSLAPRSNK